MLKKLSLLMCLGIFLNTFSQINSGNPSVPFGSNTSYDYGMMPTNLPSSGTYGQSQAAADAYNSFKTNFITNCGDNAARVKFDDPNYTVSEGIAYSMLLAAYAADQNTFDRLWQYYKNHRNVNGVMHWKISGCNTVNQQNGATDAEVDAAMSLIIADKQWGSSGQTHNYKSDAIDLINIIKDHEINATDKTFENGDMWKPDCRNPSYQAPGYARVWELFLDDNGYDGTFWNSVAVATEGLHVTNSNTYDSGLASNWCQSNGIASASCSGSGTNWASFGYDACRAPWRQSIDYLWHGSSASGMQNIIDDQVAFWISKGGASSVSGGDSRHQNGSGSGDHNGAFLGMIGAQSLAASTSTTNQTFVNSMYSENRSVSSGVYFSQVLRCIGLFSQTGNFWNPYSADLSSDNSKPTVSITSPTTGFVTCLGVDFSISATASDSDGSVTKVEFYENGELISTDLTSPYSVDITDVTAGVKNYTAKAYDNLGAEKVSTTVVVTVDSRQSADGVSCEDIVISGDYTAVIDVFDSEDPVSLDEDGTVGIYWWSPEDEDVYTITRSDENMTVAMVNAAPSYNVFGVSFGEAGIVNLEDFSNADINLNITNNTNADISLTMILEDVNGNKSEYIIEDEDDISWTNQWKKIGVDIPEGETIDETISLSDLPDMLGGLEGGEFNCGGTTGAAVTCPATSYTFDASKLAQIIFTVNGGAGEDNELLAATGDLVFNYFSIGETSNATSNIIEKGVVIEIEDADDDGVSDANDLCPDTESGIDVDEDGCEVVLGADEDNDGVSDANDLCPDTEAGADVDIDGCEVVLVADSDNDGVSDDDDLCMSTLAGEDVNSDGCALSQLDSDNDGVSDDDDLCSSTVSGVTVDVNGCEVVLPDHLYHAAIDDFNSVDEVSIGDDGEYGIYWWVGDGAESTYELTRSTDGMTVALTDANPTTDDDDGNKAFGVGFGEGSYIDLEEFSNADIQFSITNNTGSEIFMSMQLQDALGNAAEIFIEDVNTIPADWSGNRWDKISISIPANSTADETINLSEDVDQLGGFQALSWGCSDAQLCPETGYTFDASKLSGIVFTVNGGADYEPATGDLIFNYFSVGETSNPSSGIIQSGGIIDTDKDGVADADDACASTPLGASVDANGCALSQLDSDDDGVTDDDDICSNTSTGESVDANGCALSQLDSDDDGVTDDDDICANTFTGESVDVNGCALSQLDSDNDGVSDDEDLCPSTALGTTVDTDGCEVVVVVPDHLYHAAIDDFNTVEEVSIGDDGAYGIYWWVGDGAESTYELTRSTDGMTVALTNANPTTDDDDGNKAFGVGFGDGSYVDLKEFSNADIKFNITNNTDSEIFMSMQLQDALGNTADIFIEDVNTIPADWSGNRWDKISITVPANSTVNETIGLSEDLDQLGGFEALSWGCSDAQLCPQTGYTFDASQLTGIVFTVNGGADYEPVTGDLIFNYFSVGETTNPGSGIIEINSVSDEDEDGVSDDDDLCASTPSGESANSDGCSVSQLDDDNDGVSNDVDVCLNTISGTEVDATGCEVNGLENALSSGIKIFPNPAKASLNINQDNFIMTEASLRDVTGVEVSNVELANSSSVIDVSDLNTGVYILVLSGEHGSVQQRVVVD